MDKSRCTGALYLDLKKAFDTVNHACLLSKLPYYGILNTEHQWFADYLFHRSQFVSYDYVFSNIEYITYGVPQGSILGPLLFVILVNDRYLCLQKCEIMYADDTVIFYADNSAKSIEETLIKEGELLFPWLCENNLIINLKKEKLSLYCTAHHKISLVKMNVT